MRISKEKMNRIMAGEDPKAVLNAEELKVYTDALQQSGATPAGETGSDKPEGDETKGGDEEGKGGDKPEPEAEPKPAQDAMVAQLLAMNTANTTLTLQLETAKQEKATMTAEVEALKQEVKSLKPLAEAVVTNLQVCMMKPKHLANTTAGLVEQYTELKQEQASVFSTGRLSSTPEGSDDQEGDDDLSDKLAFLASREQI